MKAWGKVLESNISLITINLVVEALLERGYNPYTQLKGYLIEENDLYITSHQNARNLIKKVDNKVLETYLTDWELYQDKKWRIEFLKACK